MRKEVLIMTASSTPRRCTRFPKSCSPKRLRSLLGRSPRLRVETSQTKSRPYGVSRAAKLLRGAAPGLPNRYRGLALWNRNIATTEQGTLMAAAEHETDAPPKRGAEHRALEAFIGQWRAEGYSYGNTKQSAREPKALRDSWTSTHEARWHTGEFFLVQVENATVGPSGSPPFDTLSIMGVDAQTGRCFARSFENHGFARVYDVARNGRIWTLSGATERARIEFGDGGARQTHTWEWLHDGQWLPLCERVALRTS